VGKIKKSLKHPEQKSLKDYKYGTDAFFEVSRNSTRDIFNIFLPHFFDPEKADSLHMYMIFSTYQRLKNHL
jgi:hypothetical protein